MTNLLSKPSKMSAATSFSIPAQLCITGGKLAKIEGTVCFDCYALKGAYIWAPVQKALNYRLDKLNAPEFVTEMVAELNKKRAKLHRWFDSGDVHSVAHCLKIIAVCKLTPHKRHWIPTKERGIWEQALKMESLPDNAVVRYSAHKVDAAPPAKWENSSAVITDISKPIGKLCEAFRTKKNGAMISLEEYKTAKAEKKLGKIGLGFCGDCTACWSPDVKTVSYPKH